MIKKRYVDNYLNFKLINYTKISIKNISKKVTTLLRSSNIGLSTLASQ